MTFCRYFELLQTMPRMHYIVIIQRNQNNCNIQAMNLSPPTHTQNAPQTERSSRASGGWQSRGRFSSRLGPAVRPKLCVFSCTAAKFSYMIMTRLHHFCTYRFDVHLVPPALSKSKSLRKVGAADIGHLVKIEAMVVRISDVKPLVRVATYTCDVCGYEIFQEVIVGMTPHDHIENTRSSAT